MRGNFYSYRCQPGPDAGMAGWDVFEAMFHVGVPLALFALLGLLLPAASGRAGMPRRAAAAVCVAALWLAFAASAYHMGRLDRDPETAERERTLHDDVAAIRRALPEGSVVYLPRGSVRTPLWWRSYFYFTDYILVLDIQRAAAAEFVVVAPRVPGACALTPGNHAHFLYRMEEYRRHRGPPRRSEAFSHSRKRGRQCGFRT